MMLNEFPKFELLVVPNYESLPKDGGLNGTLYLVSNAYDEEEKVYVNDLYIWIDGEYKLISRIDPDKNIYEGKDEYYKRYNLERTNNE